jgi:hypothetical protein
MQTMHSLSREGQDPTSSRPPLDWTDRALIRRLLVDARVAFEDADAVTCDLLRKKRRRGLGHVQHKRLFNLCLPTWATGRDADAIESVVDDIVEAAVLEIRRAEIAARIEGKATPT